MTSRQVKQQSCRRSGEAHGPRDLQTVYLRRWLGRDAITTRASCLELARDFRAPTSAALSTVVPGVFSITDTIFANWAFSFDAGGPKT